MQFRHIIRATVAATALAAGLWGTTAMGQTVLIDLTGMAPNLVQINPSVPAGAQINNQQVNSDFLANAIVENTGILVTTGANFNSVSVDANDGTIRAAGIGNNAINAIFVGDTNCALQDGDCNEFSPTSAVVQIGSAQVNEGVSEVLDNPQTPNINESVDRDPVVIRATLDAAQIGTVSGDDLNAITGGSDTDVNRNRMTAGATGNVVTNEIIGDFTGLESGELPGQSDTTANGRVRVNADIAIASAQLNNAVNVTARLGDDSDTELDNPNTPNIDETAGDFVLQLANGVVFENFIGTVANGDIQGSNVDVLNNTAQALATGNEANNRIGIGLDGLNGDGYTSAIASLQINQDTRVRATVTGMAIGIVQGGTGEGDNGPLFTNSVARVNGATIGAQAIGNNAVNIIGSPSIGTVNP